MRGVCIKAPRSQGPTRLSSLGALAMAPPAYSPAPGLQARYHGRHAGRIRANLPDVTRRDLTAGLLTERRQTISLRVLSLRFTNAPFVAVTLVAKPDR